MRVSISHLGFTHFANKKWWQVLTSGILNEAVKLYIPEPLNTHIPCIPSRFHRIPDTLFFTNAAVKVTSLMLQNMTIRATKYPSPLPEGDAILSRDTLWSKPPDSASWFDRADMYSVPENSLPSPRGWRYTVEGILGTKTSRLREVCPMHRLHLWERLRARKTSWTGIHPIKKNVCNIIHWCLPLQPIKGDLK